MKKQFGKVVLLCFSILLLIGQTVTFAATDGEAIELHSPEGGAATHFLLQLPSEITGLTKSKNYSYRLEYFHFLESKEPCYNVFCIGTKPEDNQWLVVAEDNSKIYRNPGNGFVGESQMELIYPTKTLKKLKTEEDALQHLREYLLHSSSANKKLAKQALLIDPNSRADGPGTWSIEIAVGENHPDHFVTLEHFRLINNGVIEKMNILTGDYERVN